VYVFYTVKGEMFSLNCKIHQNAFCGQTQPHSKKYALFENSIFIPALFALQCVCYLITGDPIGTRKHQII